MTKNNFFLTRYLFGVAILLLGIGGNFELWAKTEKPTIVAEDFLQMIQAKQYEDAVELLCKEDRRNITALKEKAIKSGLKEQLIPKPETILADMFFMMYGGGENTKMLKKAQDGETLMPDRISFFVPGQFYEVGNFALVFTRETYEVAHAKTGPVRDDPRKLWIDPTNALSKVRDEAYFKQWWVWEDDRLTMPGILWLIKEDREWKIDLLSGVVPREAFRKILRWHFGRDVFEEPPKKSTGNNPAVTQPASQKPTANH